jgi:hypothetical protein
MVNALSKIDCNVWLSGARIGICPCAFMPGSKITLSWHAADVGMSRSRICNVLSWTWHYKLTYPLSEGTGTSLVSEWQQLGRGMQTFHLGWWAACRECNVSGTR